MTTKQRNALAMALFQHKLPRGVSRDRILQFAERFVKLPMAKRKRLYTQCVADSWMCATVEELANVVADLQVRGCQAWSERDPAEQAILLVREEPYHFDTAGSDDDLVGT